MNYWNDVYHQGHRYYYRTWFTSLFVNFNLFDCVWLRVWFLFKPAIFFGYAMSLKKSIFNILSSRKFSDTLLKYFNKRLIAELSCPFAKIPSVNSNVLNLTRAAFLWLNPERANFFFLMRSIARFNGKDNKVQVDKKHFTVTLSFAINLPFRRVESRRFFRLVSFTFFFLSSLEYLSIVAIAPFLPLSSVSTR